MEDCKLIVPDLVALAPLSEDLLADCKSLGVFVSKEPPLGRPYLLWNGERLSLQSTSALSINLDFSHRNYQRQFKPSKELLCRACGWHLGYRSLWDLTAGLGVDSVMLAQAGFTVRSLERQPLLALGLRQALREAASAKTLSTPVLERLSFEFIDAEALLEQESLVPEVIYYDPMYPSKRKSALPSKEMQILRELNGSSGESLSLFEKVLKVGARRVVVKRPHQAPFLLKKPVSSIEGKLVRFDIY